MFAVAEKLDSSSESHLHKYILTIEPTEMNDAAEYKCVVGNRSSQAKLTVDEGESNCSIFNLVLLKSCLLLVIFSCQLIIFLSCIVIKFAPYPSLLFSQC